jgi:hypothetical protein
VQAIDGGACWSLRLRGVRGGGGPESVLRLAECCGDPGQGPGSTTCTGLTFEPGDGAYAYLGLIGELCLRQANLAAQPLQLVAVDDGGPRLCRTGGPIVGMAWPAVGGVGRALGCSEACVSHAAEDRALPMSRYMPGRYPLMAYQPAGSSRGAGRQVSAAAVMLMSASSSLSMVSAESAESRPSCFAVASRAWTRRPRPEGWQLRGGRGRGRLRGQVSPGQLKITVQLACN